MDLAQKLAEKQELESGFLKLCILLRWKGNLQAQSNLGMLYNLGRWSG